MDALNIIFMGTPDFACESLRSIHLSQHKVKAVVTAPDRKAGRGQKIRFSAVKSLALELEIPVLQPTNLKSDDFLEELKKMDADLFVVVAFRMLPERVWSLPPQGTINLHASLLPDYRGAAPINWAIIHGNRQTGLSTFFIDKKIDTGAVIKQCSVDILPDDHAGSLHDKMMVTGAQLLVETLDSIAHGEAEKIEQTCISEAKMRPAPKIFKEDCKLDWTDEASSLHNKIRGLSPYPAGWTTINEKIFKIFAGEVQSTKTLNPGQFAVENGQLLVGTSTFDYQINSLQMEGKKRMSTAEFLRGMAHFFEKQA